MMCNCNDPNIVANKDTYIFIAILFFLLIKSIRLKAKPIQPMLEPLSTLLIQLFSNSDRCNMGVLGSLKGSAVTICTLEGTEFCLYMYGNLE